MKLPLRAYYLLLARYLTPLRRQLLGLAILMAGTLAIQLGNPQILRTFLDRIQAGVSSDLLPIAALFFLFGLFEQLLAVVVAYVGTDVAWKATNELRQSLFDHVLQLGLSYHQKHSPGELIERIDGDVNALRHFFSRFVLLLLTNVLLLVGILIMLLREEIWVGLLFSGFTALALVILSRLRHATTHHWNAQREASARFFGFVEEQLKGVDDIRGNGAVAFGQHRALLAERHHYRSGIQARLTAEGLLAGMGGIIAAGQTAALALAAALFLQDTFSIGTVYLVTYYIGLIVRPIRVLVFQVDDLQRAGASIQRVKALLAEPVAASPQADHPEKPKPAGPLPISFTDVHFAYDEATPTLTHISFEVMAGERLGILGRTGSGKTTLARLLFNFYQPQSGTIRIGAEPVAEIPTGRLRQMIGLVTQQVDLFAASIRDNLTFYRENVPDEVLHGLLNSLGLAPWLAQQTEGLATVLPAGGGMSAGEAQLLALARIFLQNPNIVVLDEASSRLDPATEQKIEQVLDRLLQDRTAVIIAHRLETIRRCDKILILENGRMVEFGDQLTLRLQPDSRLNQLLRRERQLANQEVG